MYRVLVTVLLCLEAVSSAPQGKESDVTYVKIQPVVEDTPADTTNARESRIEKLPLTIPGNVSTANSKEPDKDLSDNSDAAKETETPSKQTSPTEYVSNTADKLDIQDKKLLEIEADLSEGLDQSETKQSDTISDPNEETNTTDDLSEVSPTDDLSEANSDNLSDTALSETSQTDRRARNFDSQTTESTEYATGRYEDIDHTVIEVPVTRAPPKFIHKTPKSSYYPKPKIQSYSANHLDIVGKRKFKSRCSCQKIWNCPKLQISVPRCPDEYFLCCF